MAFAQKNHTTYCFNPEDVGTSSDQEPRGSKRARAPTKFGPDLLLTLISDTEP